MEGSVTWARSRLYSLLSTAFGFPGEAFFEDAASGRFLGAIEDAFAALPFALPPLADVLRPQGESYGDFQSGYIGSFEVGSAGPPCPLYAGMYLGGRNQVWEELIRFYNLFGLQLSADGRDLPDHLSTELEFMHFLAWKETASKGPEAVASLRRAQRDFLDRQVVPWTGLLAKRADKRTVPAFYRALIGLTCDFAGADLAVLRKGGHSDLAKATVSADV